MIERKTPTAERGPIAKIGDAIDRLIYLAAPAWGARRIAVRQQFAAAERAASRYQGRVTNGGFEGAREDRLRSGKWIGSRLSADSDLEEDLESLRTRSRDLFKNDSTGGAIEGRVTHVVGCGFTAQSRISEQGGFFDAAQAKLYRRQLEDLFNRWAKRAGNNRKQSLWQLTRLVERNHASDGEAFVVFSDRGDADSPIPLVLEVIDADRVETPPVMAGNRLVRMGIERDAGGKIVAYWIRKTHPHDTLDVSEAFDRVDASRVCHVFEPLVAGQSRGLPWMHRVLNRARDAKDTDEAVVIAMQVQACYSGFIKTTTGSLLAAQGAAAETTSSGQRIQELEPGTLKYLNDGEDVTFADPTQPGQTFGEFMEWTYRRTAAGMNYPYEMLVKNWSGMSFAGGRLVLAEGRLQFSCWQKLLVELLLEPVWCRVVLEAVLIAGADEGITIDRRQFARTPWAFEKHCWTSPRWPYALTPGEEVKANADAINGNQKTLAGVLAENGDDLEEVLEQRKLEVDLQRELGVLPATVPGSKVPGQDAEPAAKQPQDEPEEVAA